MFAGPNGSGKSTIVDLFIQNNLCPSEYICPDKFVPRDKKDSYEANIEAANKAELMRMNYIAVGYSFSFETVLSTVEKIEFIRHAKSKGYFITAVFVTTSDCNINLKRIAKRVSQGGHNVPSDKVFSRYEKSMNLLYDLVTIVDDAKVYDNSNDVPMLVFQKETNGDYNCFKRPAWLESCLIEKAELSGIHINDFSGCT